MIDQKTNSKSSGNKHQNMKISSTKIVNKLKIFYRFTHLNAEFKKWSLMEMGAMTFRKNMVKSLKMSIITSNRLKYAVKLETKI